MMPVRILLTLITFGAQSMLYARAEQDDKVEMSVLELRGGPPFGNATPYIRDMIALENGRVVLSGFYDIRATHFEVVDPLRHTVEAFYVPNVSDLTAASDGSGGLFLAGSVFTPGPYVQTPSERPSFLVHRNAQGQQLWGRATDVGTGVKSLVSEEGGSLIVLASRLRTPPEPRAELERGSFSDALIFKIDTSGIVQWARSLKEAGMEDFPIWSAVPGPDRGAYLLSPWRLIRVNAAGQVLWARRLAFPDELSGYANSLVAVPGGVVLAGRIISKGPAGNDVVAVAFDEAGDLKWATAVDIGPLDMIEHIAALKDGSVVLTGTAQRMGVTLEDRVEGPKGLMVRLNADGALLWTCLTGTGSRDLLGRVIEHAGALLATGSMGSPKTHWPVLIRFPVGGPVSGVVPGVEPITAHARSVRVEVSPVDISTDDLTIRNQQYIPTFNALLGSVLVPFSTSEVVTP